MPVCRTCGKKFDWGFNQSLGRWFLLEPIDSHDDLPRTFLDENGVLRADHRERHEGGSGLNVVRLEKKIPASDVLPAKRRRRAS